MSDLDFIIELLSRMKDKDPSVHYDLSVAGWNRNGVKVDLTFDEGKLVYISIY